MQGIYLNNGRPKSKKAIKDFIAENGGRHVRIQATSVFGNEYDGMLSEMPDGEVTFVGPNPETDRKFYGTLTKRGDKVTVK